MCCICKISKIIINFSFLVCIKIINLPLCCICIWSPWVQGTNYYKKVAQRLATKCEFQTSQAHKIFHTNISVAIYRSTHYCICGSCTTSYMKSHYYLPFQYVLVIILHNKYPQLNSFLTKLNSPHMILDTTRHRQNIQHSKYIDSKIS